MCDSLFYVSSSSEYAHWLVQDFHNILVRGLRFKPTCVNSSFEELQQGTPEQNWSVSAWGQCAGCPGGGAISPRWVCVSLSRVMAAVGATSQGSDVQAWSSTLSGNTWMRTPRRRRSCWARSGSTRSSSVSLMKSVSFLAWTQNLPGLSGWSALCFRSRRSPSGLLWSCRALPGTR